MVTERFEHLWGRLTRRWVAYQDAPRRPDAVPELARARADLDDARSEIRVERERIEARAVRPQRGSPSVAISDADLARLSVHVFPQC